MSESTSGYEMKGPSLLNSASTSGYEMKGPSLLNGSAPETAQQMPSTITPEMVKKLKNNPQFMNLMKQQEEKRISDLVPKERLRERLRQKRETRKPMKAKEDLNAEDKVPARKKKTKIPEHNE